MSDKNKGKRFVPSRIRKEDIHRCRQEMYIGKIIENKIEFDKTGERLVVPRRQQLEVCGIYPYLVQLRDPCRPNELPIRTITYVDLIMDQIKECGAEGEEEMRFGN